MAKRAKKTEGKQKGAQRHAEGEHGDKTRARLQEILRSGPSREPEVSRAEPRHRAAGATRLFERRRQHDEADKNSEKTRLSRDVERHGHDRDEFQLPGATGKRKRD